MKVWAYTAIYLAKEIGELGVNVFQLPGRRGWFALTETVAAWLRQQANKSGENRGGAMDP